MHIEHIRPKVAIICSSKWLLINHFQWSFS